MAVGRRPSRARFLLLILVLVAATLITLDQRGGTGAIGSLRGVAHDVTDPVERVIHSALRPIGNFLTGAANYGSLEKENDRLRQEVLSLQNQSLQASAEQAEARRVMAQAHLPFVGSIPTVAAEVINDDPSNFENTVTINKGSADGLAVGQPVVATNGLVGSIAEVFRHSAELRLLTDPDYVVGVRLSTVVGSAKGTGAGEPLQVTFDQPVEPTTPTSTSPSTSGRGFNLKKGSLVVTSGLENEAFPPGIPVARVATYSNPPHAAAPSVTLKPVVDLSSLDVVTVEIWSPQTGE